MTELGNLPYHLVTEEVLKGEDARTIMGVATSEASWQLWVHVALAYLELGKPQLAQVILEQLLDAHRQSVVC